MIDLSYDLNAVTQAFNKPLIRGFIVLGTLVFMAHLYVTDTVSNFTWRKKIGNPRYRLNTR